MCLLLQADDAHTLFTSPAMALLCRVSAPRAPVCMSHISSAGQASSTTSLPRTHTVACVCSSTQPMAVGERFPNARLCTASPLPCTREEFQTCTEHAHKQRNNGKIGKSLCRPGGEVLVLRELGITSKMNRKVEFAMKSHEGVWGGGITGNMPWPRDRTWAVVP